MDQRTRPRSWALLRDRLVPAGIVGTAVRGKRHCPRAGGCQRAGRRDGLVDGRHGGCVPGLRRSDGGRAVLCRECPARRWCFRDCAGRAAGHLLAMSAAMILIHSVLLWRPAVPATTTPMVPPRRRSSPTHHGAMLTLIGVELLCLMAASAALRLTRRQTPGTGGTAARAAVEH